jgi:hypothetical protein
MMESVFICAHNKTPFDIEIKRMRWVRNASRTGRMPYAYKIVARISEEIRQLKGHRGTLKGIYAYIKMDLKAMGYNDSSGLEQGQVAGTYEHGSIIARNFPRSSAIIAFSISALLREAIYCKKETVPQILEEKMFTDISRLQPISVIGRLKISNLTSKNSDFKRRQSTRHFTTSTTHQCLTARSINP